MITNPVQMVTNTGEPKIQYVSRIPLLSNVFIPPRTIGDTYIKHFFEKIETYKL